MNSSVITLQNAVSATGNGTVVTIPQYNILTLAVVGTFTATVNFETSFDGGTTWQAVPLMDTTGAWKTSATAAGVFSTYTACWPVLRARVTWTSGTSVSVYFMGKA